MPCANCRASRECNCEDCQEYLEDHVCNDPFNDETYTDEENMPTAVTISPPAVNLSRSKRRRAKREAIVKATAEVDAAYKLAVEGFSMVRPGKEYCRGDRNPSNKVLFTFQSIWNRYCIYPATEEGRTAVLLRLGRPLNELEKAENRTAEDIQGLITDAWLNGFSLSVGDCNCRDCIYSRRNHFNALKSLENRSEAINKAVARLLNKASNPDIQAGKSFRQSMRASFRSQDESTDDYYRPNKASSAWNDPKAKGGAARLVGVEVEYNSDENGGAGDWVETWPGAGIHEDGSCGWEAVTPPINGKYVSQCLTELCRELRANKAGCDSNCGLHVHVDARDMGWQDMRRFMLVWQKVEALMFVLGGQSRIANRGSYCVPCGEKFGKAAKAEDWKNAILDYAINNRMPSASRVAEGRRSVLRGTDKKGGGRYKAVNIMPWIAGRAFKRPDTTIEFRLHMGSHDEKQVVPWVQLLQDLMTWCIMASDKDVQALPASAARCLAIISPRSKTWLVKRIGMWRRDTVASKKTAKTTGAGTMVPVRMVKVDPKAWTIKSDYQEAM